MSLFGTKVKSTKYHAEFKTTEWPHERRGIEGLNLSTDEQLQKWAIDPDCIEKDECAEHLAKRLAKRASDAAERQASRDTKRRELLDNPFDPRTEISSRRQTYCQQSGYAPVDFIRGPAGGSVVLIILVQILK
jgi:hypothetical protein